MFPVRRKDSESLFQRFAERERPVHALVGDLHDLRDPLFPVRVVAEANLREHVEGLYLGKRTVKIDNKIFAGLE